MDGTHSAGSMCQRVAGRFAIPTAPRPGSLCRGPGYHRQINSSDFADHALHARPVFGEWCCPRSSGSLRGEAAEPGSRTVTIASRPRLFHPKRIHPAGGTALSEPTAAATDPPLRKWSDLRYVFDSQEGHDGKEALQG